MNEGHFKTTLFCDFTTTDTIQYRAFNKYVFFKKKTNYEIKTEFSQVYGNSTPSLSTTNNWTTQLKHGRVSIFDEDRPDKVFTSGTIENINDIVKNALSVKVHKIAATLCISTE